MFNNFMQQFKISNEKKEKKSKKAESSVDYDIFKDLVPLREFCRANKFPRLSQWNHWIYSEHEIAKRCIKMIGNRYYINIPKIKEYVESCGLYEVGEDKSAKSEEGES